MKFDSLVHGGRLREAAATFNIPLHDWLDLSTGINPHPYPVPAIPSEVWQRLPEEDDGLEAAAAAYYGNPMCLPVAGSQAAIQILPHCFPQGDVAIISPTYSEHAAAWVKAGHFVHEPSTWVDVPEQAKVVVLCNPNNPSGKSLSTTAIRIMAESLQARGAYLVVDEAFMDATPQQSMVAQAGQSIPNLIVLRSMGKFFGLAGSRVGFVFGVEWVLRQLHDVLGPWSLANPSRFVAAAALQDTAWQQGMQAQLQQDAQRLAALLAPLGAVSGCLLFQYVSLAAASSLYEFLAQRGILVRELVAPSALRFGLPATEAAWQRLAGALTAWAAQ